MKIGIVVAMQKELDPFLQNKHVVVEKVHNFDVYKFDMAGKQIFAVLPMSVGEICAASATQMLITKYNVDTIINFGVVGALTEEISLCSMMLVDSVVHHQFDTTAIGEELARYNCFDSREIYTDRALLALAQQVDSTLPLVRCASGDKFVDKMEEKQFLHNTFGAHICEMEAAGITICCKLNDVPCLLVKVVSDSLTGGAGEFMENVHKASQRFATFVDKLLKAM